MLPDGRTPLGALSWKGLHVEATLSDRLPMSAELRLQRLSVQRWLKAGDELQGAPGKLMLNGSWPPIFSCALWQHISCVTHRAFKPCCCRIDYRIDANG